MATRKEELIHLRNNAPKPFGLYSATCIGLDGGMGYYLNNFHESNFVDFANGLKVYRSSTYIPKRIRSRVIKKKNRVKLLEYAKTGEPILLVPSLVNKYYIFDLYEDNSLIDYLIKQGKRPFVIDWGTPTSEHEGLDLKAIIEDYILYFSSYLKDLTSSKIELLGYCMGATFSLIALAKQQDLYSKTYLVALPYNFTEMPFAGMMKFYKSFYLEYLKNSNVSADLIQTLFFMLDCKGVVARIKSFNEVTNKEQLKRMIALEDWLSDCIDVDKNVAKDILELWYDKNQLYFEDLDLKSIKTPVSLITASKDSIVPNKASLDILNEIENIEHIQVESGHIGIIIGRKSKEFFYKSII